MTLVGVSRHEDYFLCDSCGHEFIIKHKPNWKYVICPNCGEKVYG